MMPPNPRTRRGPAVGEPGHLQTDATSIEHHRTVGRKYVRASGPLLVDHMFRADRSNDAPEGPPHCPCRDPRCWTRRRWWHRLTTRPDVRAGAPSTWYGMLAAGFDPLTGDPLPDEDVSHVNG